MPKNKKTKHGEDFFDDCPICQAMKVAKDRGKDLSEKELIEAFKKANEGGAIVGGEWFEEDLK